MGEFFFFNGFRKALQKIVPVLFPLIILLGCFYLLVSSSVSRLTGSTYVLIILGSVGTISGMFYLVENVRFILESKPSRFYFGLGNEIKRISREEILSLTSQADRSYLSEKKSIKPSLAFTIRNIFTWRGLLLAGSGAFIAYILPFSSSWVILGGALIGLIIPYPVSIVYFFFCSYMHRYKYRSEFVRRYLEDEEFRGKITESSDQTESKVNFLAPVDYVWRGFSLELPVITGLAAFAVEKFPLIILGLLISSAVLPFMGLTVASASFFQLFISIFGSLGWDTGFHYSVEAMYLFAGWNLPHTVSDLSTLATVAYVLGSINIPYQVQKLGPATFPSAIVSFLLAPIIPLVGWLFFPVFWILSLGRLKYKNHASIVSDSFTGFWAGFYYLWIIYAVINVFIRCGSIIL